jgi:hypothetical protein
MTLSNFLAALVGGCVGTILTLLLRRILYGRWG